MDKPGKREPSSPTAGGGDSGQDASASSPDSETGRRAIRSRYLAVKHLICDERDDVGKPDSDKFQSIMNEVDNLHKLVQKPREQVADAEALLDIANSLFSSVRAHNKDGITASDFVDCVLQEFGKQNASSRRDRRSIRNRMAWKDIGIAVSHIFSSSRGCATMIGPTDCKIKQRKTVVRNRRVRPIDSAIPEEIDVSSPKTKTDTDRNMAIMFGILKSKRSVLLENLVLNRDSFAQTVENLFALSFLVKDGRAEIKVDEKRRHLVSPRNAPAASQVTSKEVAYRHFVFRFDFKDWKLMRSVVGVGEELMPNRSYANTSERIQPNGERVESHGQVVVPKREADELGLESHGTASTPPIRLFSRNRGLVLHEDTVVQDSSPESDDAQARAAAAIRKGKRKLAWPTC
ncbi:hypothetical protein Tsubulata_037465 [Turnera subulata]|uniref:Non-structural maintenance of chromosomes element 4 n=1 Tax=Turnera subulata TaxID=218843 RepID=A0A9Q0FV27_9ROSI|nr:hypothetical protein Tsubulata_037465 [Turnera subulata]